MKFIITICACLISVNNLLAQASLEIQNNSIRSMTVKVMRGVGKGQLHKTVTIHPNSTSKVNFSTSGLYFTKTRAVLSGKEPIYRKSQSFEVVNDETGYSVYTLVFTIRESAVAQSSGGKSISRTEFDQN